jgi:flagellar M-ring protein FliF
VQLGEKAGLVLLAIIVGVVMMVRRKKSAPASVSVSASDLPDGVLMPARMDAIAADRRRELGPGPDDVLSPVQERERRRDEVASFVDSQPEEIAQLVQGWLSQRSN